MLKVISRLLATLNLLKKHNVKDALLLELLKENKKLKLELSRQKQVLVSEILKTRAELYDERLYSRFKDKERKQSISKSTIKVRICKRLIAPQTCNYLPVYG